MKFNYDFPYSFKDFSNEGIEFIEIDYEQNDIVISIINLPTVADEIDIVLEVENTQTFFRKVYIINDDRNSVRISISDVGNKAKYSLTLVANKTGVIEFDGYSEFYEFGDCIGLLKNDIISIEKEIGLSGLIKVGSTDNDTISYDLTSDWLTILLPQKSYEKYVVWQHDDDTVPFILASLANSCIQFAIFSAKNDNKYSDYVWWEIISNSIIKMGYDIEFLDESEIPDITNKFLDNCFQKMLDAALPAIDAEDTSILS